MKNSLVKALRHHPPVTPNWLEGDKVVFHPSRGEPRKGTIKFDFDKRDEYLLVQLQGDPYPVYIPERQIEMDNETEVPSPKRAAKKRPATKKVAKRAVKASKATKKAPASKRAPTSRKATGRPTKAPAKVSETARKRGPKPVERPVDNPFRPGSNSHHYVEGLKKGGKRSTIVRALMRKINVHPWNNESYDDPIFEIEKRLTMVVRKLEKDFGWHIERRGRGSESFIKVTPPNGKVTNPAKKTRKRVSS